ncbi:vancomycin resistance protein VanJ [Streptomyces sp. 2224.1]|nr:MULTISPECIES: endonuclease/exonuclease/phosphatase family protein [unclassified Streptomyces]PBC82064.1 vancomycin resistance protein VanJ [Streptomyces sp. 2321.6]SDR51668.1 vancomycin resistance protein VanJ [Streptomyces sp. KS_16]SEC42039.1 vancomycin resistance protein VanJ [Streptomyces sp. 2133.1]SEC61383.1 vancomycin resistance protein VanJ [Streptomyces sp. 2224.1]SEF02262.1 vancomycin resistance protein VanJ [Streptomyces sp. 2112.3]
MAQAYMTEPGQGRNPGEAGSRAERLRSWWRPEGMWRRGLVLAVLAVLVGLLMMLHSQIPNTVGNLGSLLETFLPWLGLCIPLLLVVAVLRRSATALVALVLPVFAWISLFGGQITDKAGNGGNLTVATHNVNADNPDPASTARDIVASDADVVALEELTGDALPVYRQGLAKAYPYHTVEGTVGLWSKRPLSETKPVDIKMGWTRALRATVTAADGQKFAVYVAHLPSVRVKVEAGFTAGQRDGSAAALGEAIAADPEKKVMLLGDLNGTMNDRSLAPVTSQMRSAQGAAGDGFGFSWPAAFPMARIDQIMMKGMDPVKAWVMPETGSDHLPVAATVKI